MIYRIHYTISSTFIADVEAYSEEDARAELAPILHRCVVESLEDNDVTFDEINVKEIIIKGESNE